MFFLPQCGLAKLWSEGRKDDVIDGQDKKDRQRVQNDIDGAISEIDEAHAIDQQKRSNHSLDEDDEVAKHSIHVCYACVGFSHKGLDLLSARRFTFLDILRERKTGGSGGEGGGIFRGREARAEKVYHRDRDRIILHTQPHLLVLPHETVAPVIIVLERQPPGNLVNPCVVVECFKEFLGNFD